MRNHTLMQTIARANRVFPGKHSGVIVDLRQRVRFTGESTRDLRPGPTAGTPCETSAYTPDVYQQKCLAVFEHVYESYPARDASRYADR